MKRPVIPIADELLKLKQLLDSNLITQQEIQGNNQLKAQPPGCGKPAEQRV